MKRSMFFGSIVLCLVIVFYYVSAQSSSGREENISRGVQIKKIIPDDMADERLIDRVLADKMPHDEAPPVGTLVDEPQSEENTEFWNDEKPAYVKAYTDFLLYADIDQGHDLPIRGYYLFDLNFDDIPELGILHDSYGSMGGYFTYYYFDGNEIKAILSERGEPARASNYTQILADFEQKKVYMLKEMYLLRGNINGTYGYVREIKSEDQVPCVYDILNLEVDQESDLTSHFGKQYECEDDFLSDPELEDCLITQRYLDQEWIAISSGEYLKRKRELIPEENSFVDLRREDLNYLGENFDEDGYYIDVKMSEEEIELLFRRFVLSLE